VSEQLISKFKKLKGRWTTEQPKTFMEYFIRMRTLLDDCEKTTDAKTTWNCLAEIETITRAAKTALALRVYNMTKR
jgi:hypothetical protein